MYLKNKMRATIDSPAAITVNDVVSSWVAGRGRLPSGRMAALIRRLLAQVYSEGCIEPRVSFQVWKISERGWGQFRLDGGESISSSMLGHYLPGATHVTAGVCTIGDGVEKRVREAFAELDYLGAVILDQIGTLALFRLGDQLESLIRADAVKRGLDASGPLNPGEEGLEISQQPAIVRLANGGSVGISVTSGGMLAPRKSLSVLAGLGRQMPKWGRGQRCGQCGARERCSHRRLKMNAVMDAVAK